MSVLDKLTEGIVNRDLQKEGAALLNKWEKTGLLEGLNSDQSKDGMARLLENQAKELLREASTMAGGDVEGFAAVAFPIVRRVFGSLIANDLVSVQPMSLPSGLIFFLDFTVDGAIPSPAKAGYDADASLYGQGVVGSQLTGGVDLSGSPEAGPYALNNGYSSPTGSAASASIDFDERVLGHVGVDLDITEKVRYDMDLSGSDAVFVVMNGHSTLDQLDMKNLVAIQALDTSFAALTASVQARRLTTVLSSSTGNTFDPTNTNLEFGLVFEAASGFTTANVLSELDAGIALKYAETDNYTNGSSTGTVVGDARFDLENNQNIPEINIKVDSVAVTAQTKKLKAKWTPELGQDLNAYHNLDAEVELTSILSEQIALEIDREILEDLIKGATAGTQYWSRRPGKFVVRTNGRPISALENEQLLGADFTGTVSEWYETLAETINDVSAQIHRKTLRGGANFVVCSPEVANILEFTAGFRASVTHDADRGSIGAVNVGSLSKKFDVYVDPYFPRNVVLVGRKGGSFLESGYVYAPYVPLQVTPTIFGVEDFVPRKGVMTRYAKKMVRPDMYGLVICEDMNG